MNTAIVLLVVCAAAVEVFAEPRGHGPHGPHAEKMKQNMEECMESTGADAELVKASRHGDGVPDEKVKCFHACIGKKMGMMNEDGTLNKEKMTSIPPHIPEEKREEFAETSAKCAEMAGENECDLAYNVWKCMRPVLKPHHRKQGRE